MFAFLHPQGLEAVPGLMGIAMGLAAIRERRDSLIAPVVAHAINNGLIFAGLGALLVAT